MSHEDDLLAAATQHTKKREKKKDKKNVHKNQKVTSHAASLPHKPKRKMF